MDCRECHKQLLDYYRGLLAREDATVLERHLESCAACGELVRAAGLLPQLLSCDAQAPPRAVNAVLAMAREYLARQRTLLARPQPVIKKKNFMGLDWGGAKGRLARLLTRPAGLAWAAGALLLVLVIGFATFGRLSPRGSIPLPPHEMTQAAAPVQGALEMLLQQKTRLWECAQRAYPVLRVMDTLGGGAVKPYERLRGLLVTMSPTNAPGEARIQSLLAILDVKTGLCVGPQGLGELLLLRRVTADSTAGLTKIEVARDCLLLAYPLKVAVSQGLEFYRVPGVADVALAGSFGQIDFIDQASRPLQEVWAVGLKENEAGPPWMIGRTELKQTPDGKVALTDPEARGKWTLGAVLLDDRGLLAGWLTRDAMNSSRIVSAGELESARKAADQAVREAAAPRIQGFENDVTTSSVLIRQTERPGIITFSQGDHLH